MKEHASFNRCYRLLWSGTTEQWKPVPETARTAKKGGRGKAANTLTLAGVLPGVAMGLFVMSNLAAQPPPAPPTAPATTQLPTGGTVAAGQATISQSAIATAANMVVNQTSQRAVIDWSNFNVGSGATVQFVQPNAQSVILNRVLDANPTQVFGRINANGQVFLTNPYGVYFAPSASVDVGGLVATTYSISNDDFMAGRYTFNRNGSNASVINQGNLSASLGGYIALLAPEVQNSGVVLARAGTVAFAAGEQVSLSIVDGKGLSGITTTASAIASLIDNKLAVQAPDGQIILSAVAVNKLQAGVIKNSGSLQATSLSNQGGKIVLEADEIDLASTASIDVSGRTRGGTVLMGGDWQGSGNLRQATAVRMAAGATINANATDSGDGGKVVLWSNVTDPNSTTTVAGSIYASAGPNGGNGGQIETSGHYLNVDGIAVSTRAPKGAMGEWLLDPANITISSSADNNYTNATGTFSPNSTNTTSTINNVTLSTALGSTNITITTVNNGTAAASSGNITISGSINWSNATTLTLVANDSISGAGGIAMTGGGSVVFNNSNASTTAAYTGVISGNGSVSKQGSGILTLSGANTYSGGTTVEAGTLTAGISNSAATYNSTSGRYDFANGPFGTGVVKVLSGASLNVNNQNNYNPLEIAGSGVGGMGAIYHNATSGSSPALYGNITLTQDNSVLGSYNSTGALGLYVWSNIASAAGTNYNLTANGSSIMGLRGNTSLGTITVKVPTLALQAMNNNLTFNNSFVVNSTSTLNIYNGAGFNVTVNGNVSGGGNVLSNGTNNINGVYNITGTTSFNASTNSLNINSSTDTTLASLITGAGNLTVLGTGNLTLTGNSTGFTGPLNITTGSNVTIGDGATSGIVNASIVNNGTLNFNRTDAVTAPGVISGTGTLNKLGSNVLTLSGNNNFSGAINVKAGTLKSGYSTGSTTSGGLGTNATITLSDVAGVILDVNGTTTYAGSLNGGANTTLNIGIASSTFGVGNNNGASTFSGQIAGSGTLYKMGTGTFTLSGWNSAYTGGITVAGGNLTLALPTDTAISTVFSGAGKLVQAGPGNVTLTSNSTGFSGSLAIENGSNLTLGAGSTSGIIGNNNLNASVSGINISNNGTLNFNHSDNNNMSGVISGSGAVNQQGTGNLTLSGNNTYAGNTTISSGMVYAGVNTTGGASFTSAALGLGTIKVLSGGTFVPNGQYIYNPIEIAGTGAANSSGALWNSATSGTSNVYGNITLTANNAQVGSNTSSPLNLYGDILSLASNSYGFTVGGSAATHLVGSKSIKGNIAVSATSFYLDPTSSANVTFANNFTVASGATLYIAPTASYSVTVNGSIAGAGDAKIGAALTTLGSFINGSYTLAGTTNITANNNLTLNNSADAAWAGTITGFGNLTVAGTGKLSLTGNSTGFTGKLNINAGSNVTIGDGATSGIVGAGINNNGIVNFNRSDAVTYAGLLFGSGQLNKLGSNVLTLTGNNTFAGNTTIQSGVLKVTTNNLSLGSNPNVTISDTAGAGLEIGVTGFVLGSLSGGANATLNVSTFGVTAGSNNLNTTFAGALVGSGTFTKNGTGNLTLSGNSGSFTGNVTSNGTGALVFTNTTVIGNGTNQVQLVANGSSLELQNVTNFANPINVSDNATLLVNTANASLANNLTVSANKIATLNVTAGLNLSVSGRLNGAGVIKKNTDGLVTLSGNNSAFTGTLNVSKGLLVFANNLSLGTLSAINTGNVTLGTVSAAPTDTGNGTVWLNASDTTLLNNLTVNASGAITGNANLNISNSSYRLILNAGSTSSLSGVISGPGNLTLGAVSTPVGWTLSGANTFASFALNSVNLTLVSDSVVNATGAIVSSPLGLMNSNTSSIDIGTNSVLDINGHTLANALKVSTGKLVNTQGTGQINGYLNGGSNFEINVSDNSSLVLSGELHGAVAGSMSLIKSGNGTLNVQPPTSGTQIFSGTLQVNAGKLILDAPALSIINLVSPITISTGASFEFWRTNVPGQNFNVTDNGLLRFNRSASLAVGAVMNISGTGAVQFSGTAPITWNPTGNNYTGGTTIDPGAQVTLAGTYNFGNVTVPVVNNGNLTVQTTSTPGGMLNQTITGTGNVIFATSTNTTWVNVLGNNTYTGTTTLTGNGTVYVGSYLNTSTSGSLGTGNITISDNTALVFARADNTTVYNNITSTINSTLAKSQNNVTLDLAGNINLTGAMKVYGGTLQIDANGSMGNTSTHVYNGAISFFNTSTFQFSSATDAVLNGGITQNATTYNTTLIKDTSVSNLTLNGNNNYTNTVLETGTLYVGSGGAITAGKLGTGTVVDNASLVFNHSGAYFLSNVSSNITGTGNVTVLSTDNNLTIDRNITLTGSNSLIKLMAGTSLAANNATGNVTLSNTTSTTSTGSIIVYAGSPVTVNTTTLMSKMVGASGAVGYKTYNATLSNISSAVAGTRNFFYRIQPTATINGGNVTATKVYDGTTIAYPNYTGGGSTTGIDGDTLTGCVTGASYNTSSAGNKSLVYNVSIVSNNASWVVAGYAGTVNPTSTVANITQAPLIIQANDAADFVTLAASSGAFGGVSYSGFVHGENATTAGLTGTLAITRSNSSVSSAGSYTLMPGGQTANNYAITYRPGTYTIVPAQQLIIRVNDGTSVYGDVSNLSVSSVTYLMPDNVTIANLTPSLTLSSGLYSVNDGVGGTASFKLGLSNANLTGSNNAAVGVWNVGYNNLTIGGTNFNSIVSVGTQTITKRDLTLTTVADNKVYDGNTNATFNISTNRIAGDNLTLSTDALGVFASKNAANGTVVTVGNITISGNDASNYNLLSNVSSTTANITPKTLTLNGLSANNKVYDATTNASIATLGTVSGVLGLDDVQVGTSMVTGAFSDKNEGIGKTVTLTGFTMGGAEAGNYKIDSATTTANITPKALTVSGLSVAASKVYDGTTSAAPLGTANLQDAIAAGTGTGSDGKAYAGDAVSVTGTPVGTYNSKDVATAANVSISGLSLTGAGSSNYVLTAPAPLAATITRKDLTIKVNDDAQFFTIASSNVGFNGLSYNGLVTGETSANLVFSNTSAPGVPNISTSLNATQKSTAGVYTGALTLDGTVTNSNYNITVQTGNFTVVGADQLLVRVNNVNTTYGSTANLVVGSAQYVNSNVNGTSNVLLNLSVSSVGNQVTVDDGLNSGGGAVMTLAPTGLGSLSGSNNAKVGIYNIGATSLVPINGANFNNTVVVVGQQTVTAKALNATATAADKTYNSNASASVTVTSTDVIAGDLVGYTYTSAEFLNKNAGTNKAVTVANISLNGTDAGNYVIQNLVASTTANISQKALTVTGITAANKVYDGNTSAVVNVSAVNSTSLVTMGMVSGDNLTVAATGAFGNKNVGDGKTVTLTSTYSGADVGNYLITSQANTTANISQKTLTITGITADNKVYNGSNLATVNVSALNSTTLVGMGMVTGDNLTVTATGVFADKNVGTNKTVNLSSSYSGADAGNYNITSQVNTTANITAKDVTLAAPQATQVYNGSAIYTANATQLAALSAELGVVGDSVTGVTLTYNNANAATGKTLTASNAVISDGNGGHNYNVSYTTNTTSIITAKDVTLSAPQATQVYNGSAIYTANATQLAALSTELGVVGDSVTGVTLTYNNANAATGKTLTASSAVISDGNGGHNYNVSYASNTTSVITAKDVTLAAPQATRAYDGTANYTANATQLAALSAALGVAGDSVSNITLAYNNPNAATGKTLTASNVTISDGNNGSNYNVSYTSNTTSVITAKDVTLAAPQATRAYDGTANYTANATQLAALTAALGVAGDSVSNITLVYNNQNAATGKTLTASNVTINDGNGGHNYNVSYGTNTTSIITAKDVTLTAPQATRTYDGTVNYTANAIQLAALTAELGVAGDSVSNITLAYVDQNAATGKTLTASGAVISDGNNGLNYNISYASNTTSVITAKDVTLAAPQATRAYDGTVNYTANATQLAALTAALGVAGDSVSNIALAYNDKNAATGKTLTASNVTISDGNNGLNYNVSYTSNTTSAITVRDITLAAPQATRAYDGTVNYIANATQLAALSAVLGGVGDSVSSITLTYNDKNAATGKTLTASNVTISDGNNGLNYNVSYTSNVTSVITPKVITISGITAANKVYDGDTTAVVNVSAVNNTSLVGMGLVAGDNLSVAATGAFADKNVGSHKIVNLNSTYSGSDVGNYNITSQTSTWADITASTSSQNTSTSSGASQSQPATVDSAALVKSIAPPVITLPPAAVTVRVPLAMPSLNLPEATTTTAVATDNVKAKETKADATDDSMSSQKALALVTQTRAPVIETSNTPTTTLALPATPTTLPTATATAAATPAATTSTPVSTSATAAPSINTPPTAVASVAAPTSEVKVAPSGSAPPANQVASTPRASGVLPVSVLGDSRMANVGLAFEEQPNDIRIQMTASPDVPKLAATGVRFAGNFKTFMVGNDRGEMVTYQGAMIGKRMVVVAETEASKNLARQDMQTVLAAAITTLGSTGAISLTQMEGVVLDLR